MPAALPAKNNKKVIVVCIIIIIIIVIVIIIIIISSSSGSGSGGGGVMLSHQNERRKQRPTDYCRRRSTIIFFMCLFMRKMPNTKQQLEPMTSLTFRFVRIPPNRAQINGLDRGGCQGRLSPGRTDTPASSLAWLRPAPPPRRAPPRLDPPELCLGFGFHK